MDHNFDTQGYLDMELLRFTTAGSVDDGKSTLIGRLLYDSKSIFEDQLEAVESASNQKGIDGTDLSLLTDGLKAEREQGITIDVAYRYFATPKRKFIIADTPGHDPLKLDALHQEHGHGRIHRGLGHHLDRRQTRPLGTNPQAQLHCVLAGIAARRGVRQQNGLGGVQRRTLQRNCVSLQGILLTSEHHGHQIHPHQRPPRRQRGGIV